jgi:hypothetical protein
LRNVALRSSTCARTCTSCVPRRSKADAAESSSFRGYRRRLGGVWTPAINRLGASCSGAAICCKKPARPRAALPTDRQADREPRDMSSHDELRLLVLPAPASLLLWFPQCRTRPWRDLPRLSSKRTECRKRLRHEAMSKRFTFVASLSRRKRSNSFKSNKLRALARRLLSAPSVRCCVSHS